MSDKPIPAPGSALDAEQVAAVSGGTCSPSEVVQFLNNLTHAYETLVDFTSHVMERVVQ